MDIRENLAQIGEELRRELENTDGLQAIDSLRVRVLGKKGSLTALLRGMGALSPGAPQNGPADQRGAGKIHRAAG